MRRSRCLPWIVAVFLVSAAIAFVPRPAHGALIKPSYAAGDRWVYDLDGSLATFPGLNASQFGPFSFGMVGRVEVAVVGPASATIGNTSIPSVQVATSASGFLNGTFTIPGGPSAAIHGSFTTSSTEFWEEGAYLPVRSTGSSSYAADVTYVVTLHLDVQVKVNATTTLGSVPPFGLDVGENASAPLTTDVRVNSTFTFAGQTSQMDNETTINTTWHREVLSQQNITVGAGTFLTYKMNQTLGSFPGIPGALEGNETAYFSNDAGYYAKREAYTNGTRAAELSLKSYSYSAHATGLSVYDIALFVVLPIVLAAVVVFLIWRRRKGQKPEPSSPATGEGPPAR